MIREFEPNDTNEIIKAARKHVKELKFSEHYPFDDVHFIKYFREYMMKPNTVGLHYSQGGNIIGYIAGTIGTKMFNPSLHATIDYFWVDPEERNKYVADSLVDAFMRDVRIKGCFYVESSVMSWGKDYAPNEDSIRRASIYFERKGGLPCGNVFVFDLEDA